MLYLAYSSIITKFAVAKEWSLFSVDYQPLRVTDPFGDQISSYFLGLPYKYGVPLIMVSTLLHWVTSKTIYVVIFEGGELAAFLASSQLSSISHPASIDRIRVV